MASNDGRQELICACGHTGVLYTSPDHAPLHPGLRVGSFINRSSAGLDLTKLHCGACHRQGHVREAGIPKDRCQRFTGPIGLTIEKRGGLESASL